MGYNPADYKAVQSDAIAMSKKELEEYYVKGKNESYKTCCDLIGMIFVVFLFAFFIGAIGYILAQENAQEQVKDSLIEVQEEVCPYLWEGYESQEFLKDGSIINSIDCSRGSYDFKDKQN